MVYDGWRLLFLSIFSGIVREEEIRLGKEKKKFIFCHPAPIRFSITQTLAVRCQQMTVVQNLKTVKGGATLSIIYTQSKVCI